jgi:hypothetical protein
MLFPQLGPQYYNEQDKGILQRMEAFYAESITINQSFWGEADTDTRFEVGDQTLWTDLYGNLPANRRRQFCFNRIRPIINMISGHQRRTRKSTIVVPVENGDAETADQFTKVMLWTNNQESVLETISESFHGALVTGMNLLQVWVDYRSDPVSGNIKVDNCSYNSFLIDPYFRKTDLSDCNAIWKRSFLTKREALSLLPDSTEEILGLVGNDSGTGRDGKFQFMPESYNYGYKNLLTYDEFWYRDYRTQTMLIDSQTGETQEWRMDKDSEDALKLFLAENPTLTSIEQEVPTVKLAVVVQGKVMYHGPNPLGIDQYPFVPVLGYYNPQMPYFPWRIQGVVRGLRDAQYLYNRRKIIELDILESQINSGWIYKENALVNPKDVFLSGQGRGLALKTEAQMTDVQQIQSPSIPPAVIELSNIMSKEISQISGVNEELLGSAQDDKAGILSMLRQGSGLTTLQVLFDQLDRSQRILGKIIIDIIQANFAPGKVKKILEGQEPSDQFYNKSFGRYNAAIEDGLNTATQRQMQFAQMLQLHEAGVPITTEDLLEAATIQNKKTIIENATKQKEQAMQQQQQESEMAMQLQQAQVELSHARAQADQGLFMERASRVQENRALAIKQIHEANKEDELAVLNKVKALKELEMMDLEHLNQLIAIAGVLKGQEQGISEEGVAQTYSSNPQTEAQESMPQAQPQAQAQGQNPMMQSLAGLA